MTFRGSKKSKKKTVFSSHSRASFPTVERQRMDVFPRSNASMKSNPISCSCVHTHAHKQWEEKLRNGVAIQLEWDFICLCIDLLIKKTIKIMKVCESREEINDLKKSFDARGRSTRHLNSSCFELIVWLYSHQQLSFALLSHECHTTQTHTSTVNINGNGTHGTDWLIEYVHFDGEAKVKWWWYWFVRSISNPIWSFFMFCPFGRYAHGANQPLVLCRTCVCKRRWRRKKNENKTSILTTRDHF